VHNDILQSLDLTGWGSTAKRERGAFETLYTRVLKPAMESPPIEAGGQETRSRLNLIYWQFFRQVQEYVGHCFRHLYHIVRFVHESNVITSDEKQLYVRLLRAQLSSYELVILFYNCLAEGLGAGKFERLVIRYALLEHMPAQLLFNPAHSSLFPPEAYGDREPAQPGRL